MADQPGAIPSPNEPFINPDGNKITRTWYRVLAALTKQSGQLSQSITVKENSVFTSTSSLNSGGTLEPVAIPSGSVLGNSSGSNAAASPQSVDSSLSLENGTLGLAKASPLSLLGNAGSVAATPVGNIAIGSGLTLVAGSPPTLEATGGSTTDTGDLAQVLSWWRQ